VSLAVRRDPMLANPQARQLDPTEAIGEQRASAAVESGVVDGELLLMKPPALLELRAGACAVNVLTRRKRPNLPGTDSRVARNPFEQVRLLPGALRGIF
jgi:hypothetical protein